MNKNMVNKRFTFLLIPFFLFTLACDRVVDDPQDDEMARLEAWLQVNNITDQPTPSGLYYISKQDGTGISPLDTNFIIVSYTVKSFDNDVFETTDKSTAKLNEIYHSTTHYVPSFTLSYTQLKGLNEGLSMMREGGKARLIIPSKLGFGKKPYSYATTNMQVPSYTTLIYDIELHKVIVDPVAYEQSLIVKYLADNPGFTSISDSIYIKKIDDGAKLSVTTNDSVHVSYTGRFLDGFIFDTNNESIARDSSIYSTSNSYEPLKILIGTNSGSDIGLAIKQNFFEVALKHMIEGESAIIIVPSEYAFGVTGYKVTATTSKSSNTSSITTTIPPYTTLIYEIELEKVVKNSQDK